ncbi:MAG: TonB-dependent receptor [Ekhidna sp.]
MKIFIELKKLASFRFKIDLKMKLTSLLIISSLFQVYANNTFGQKTIVSMNLENVSVENVLSKIESLTEYKFLYNDKEVDYKRKVSVNANEEYLSNILTKLFENTNTSFEIFEEQIVLKPRPPVKKKIVQVAISGKITSEDGEGLPGATILIKGTTNGVQSDIDGNYRIVANEGDILAISYVGFVSTEVVVDSRTVIDVVLKADLARLGEVVVVGYGTTTREALTGSVGTIEAKSITNQAPTVNLDYALQGQVAGVYISSATGQPGAASRVRIRGTSSIFGSNQPLYVIDGIPVVPNSNIPVGGPEGGVLGNQLDQQGLSTPLGNINNADVESISVLKDASAAAIYGSRAANGVIIITTKKGAYATAPRFNVDFAISSQEANTLSVLNADQFKQVWTTAVENGSSTDAFATSVLDESYFGDADTNWENEISPNNPLTSTFNLNVQGGSAKTRYSTSIGVNNQDGVLSNTGFDRYSFNLNLDTELSDIFQFGSSMNLSHTDQNSADRSLIQLMYDFRPDVPVFDEDGNYSFSAQYTQENPVARTKSFTGNKTLLFLGSFYTQIKVAEGLNLKTLFGLNYNNGNQKSFYPKFTFRGGWDRRFGDGDGYAQESRSRFTNTLFQNTLTYDKIIDVHNINAVLGASFERTSSSFNKAWGEGFSNDVLSNISNATVFTSGSSDQTGSGLASYFGRINYGYDNKYLVTLSARMDGSSKFAVDNRYAFFPAAAVAWRISEEPFLSSIRPIVELKLRTSLGKTGQQDFGPYAWRTLFESSNYGGQPSVIQSQLGNDQLKWETTNQFDVGLDYTLFDGRLSGVFNYYIKETHDALFTAITPGSSGTARVIANVGDTKNTGIEIELRGDIITKDDFNWNVSFNISKNQNELTAISDDFKDENGFLTGFGGGGRLRVGNPIGLIYGYVAEGIFQTQDEIDALNTGSPTGFYQDDETSPGDLRFRDITGPDGVPDGRITSLDQQVIGDTQPDFFGGFNSEWNYKGFTLTAFFTYSIGNDLDAFALARSQNFASTFFGENKVTDVLNAWTPENRDSNIPRSVYRDPNNNDRTSSHYVYDASYVRLKTLSLRYTLSPTMTGKMGIVNSASIYLTAQNLFTITDYPGADPEASNLFNNDISAGRDNNRFPIARVFTMGVNIGF